MSIEQFLEDEFDRGEIERIVRIEATGRVETIRAQPEMEPCTVEKLKRLGVSVGLRPVKVGEEAARMYRDRERVREGMSQG